METDVKFVIGAALVFQFAAAAFALRLIRVTRWHTAWILISISIFLIAIRRLITLLRLISDDLSVPPDMTYELVGLAISVFMFAGMAWLAPLFFSISSSEKEMREAVKKIAEEKARSEAIIAAIGDGISIQNAAFKILYQNQTHKDMVGSHIGEYCYKAYNDREKICEECPVDMSFNDGLIHKIEKCVLPGKKMSHIETTASPLKDSEGKTIAVIEIVRDISRRKQTEEELQKYREHLEEIVKEHTADLTMANEFFKLELEERKKMEEELLKAQKLESLGILAGGIAHDFNNALTGILGNIALAKMQVNPEDKIFRQLTSAEKATLRAQKLTHQLLTFAMGGVPIKQIISIAELLEESIDFTLKGSNVSCNYSIAKDLWAVEIDEGQINQVFSNLTINAQQAMPEGGILTVRAENITADIDTPFLLKGGKYIKISVEDHGFGIPEEQLSRIFDPYFTTKQKGSGLGLATTYSIIKNHDGHIMVESKSGIGTIFHIYLPASGKEVLAKKDLEEGPIAGNGKILLMDDEAEIREATGEALTFMGYDTSLAEDGIKTIELYKKAMESQNPFDAVIMDLIIPGGMGGKEAIKKLIEIDPDVRVIVSSGYSNDPVMADFKEYGFRDFIIKPYKIEDLGKVLHRVITG